MFLIVVRTEEASSLGWKINRPAKVSVYSLSVEMRVTRRAHCLFVFLFIAAQVNVRTTRLAFRTTDGATDAIMTKSMFNRDFAQISALGETFQEVLSHLPKLLSSSRLEWL